MAKQQEPLFLVCLQGDSDKVSVHGFLEAKRTGRRMMEHDHSVIAILKNTETGEVFQGWRKGAMTGFRKVAG